MEDTTGNGETIEAKPEIVESTPQSEETKPIEIKSQIEPKENAADKIVENKTAENVKKEEEEEADEGEKVGNTEIKGEKLKGTDGNEEKKETTEETTPPEDPPASMHFVKIARIPKEILNFMTRNEEEEGTVRINLTQMKLFITELWKMGRYVNGSVWDDCDFPKLDMVIPKCAQKFTIIPDFNAVNGAATEEKVAANIEKYREQEKKQYAKMSDHQKRKTWKDLKREYVITNNVITTAGAAAVGPENPKVLYSKKQTNVEETVPSQIKPADPLPVAEAKLPATAKPGKAANKSDVKNDRKRILSATTAPVEGQTPVKKPEVNKAKGPAGPKVAPKPSPNRNIMKKNGNKPMFNNPKTAKPQMKQNMRNGPRQGNPWREEPRPRNDYPFNAHPYYQQTPGLPPPASQMYGYRDVYPPRDAYYDPSRFLENRPPGGGNYGVEREYRTTFDDYSSRGNFSSDFGYPPRPDPAYDSHVQHGYGSRF